MVVKISFIITNYNNKKDILRCIKSAKSNIKGDIKGEIIVVDDCSTDGSYEMLKKLKSKYNYKLFQTKKNMGPAAARNIGIKHSSGDYFNFIDGDDYILSNKIKSQIKQINHSKSLLSYTDCLVLGRGNAYLLKNAWPTKSGFIYDHLLNGSCFAIHAVLVPSVIAKKYFFDESLRQAEDYEYWLRVSKNYKFEFLDRPLVVYNLNGSNLTKDIKEALFYTKKVYTKILNSKISKKQKEIVKKRIMEIDDQPKEEIIKSTSLKSRLRLKINRHLLLLKLKIVELL